MQRGKALELLKELRKLKSESDDLAVEPGLAIQGRFSSFPGTWYLWLYKRYLCWHNSVDAKIAQLDHLYDSLSKEVEALSNQEHQSTGNAVIIFNWVPDAANMLYDHNLRNGLANLFVPPFIGRSFNIATRGKFAQTYRMVLAPRAGDGQDDGQGQVTHRHVSVTRAPEPSDFMWENTQFGGWPIVQRRIVAWVCCLPLLTLGVWAHWGVLCLCSRLRSLRLAMRSESCRHLSTTAGGLVATCYPLVHDAAVQSMVNSAVAACVPGRMCMWPASTLFIGLIDRVCECAADAVRCPAGGLLHSAGGPDITGTEGCAGGPEEERLRGMKSQLPLSPHTGCTPLHMT